MLDMIRDFLFFLVRYFQRKKAAEIVLNAEVLSYYSGIYSVEIIKEIYRKQRKKNEYLERVLKKYEVAKKYEIYSDIFDKEFLKILRIAEEKHIPLAGVFKDYKEIKTKIEKAKKSILNAVLRPIFVYLIASFLVFWALGNILKQMGSIRGVDFSMFRMFYDYYWFIILSIPSFVLLGLFKFPRKLPFLSKAYKELDGFQLLSLCKLFLSMGISTVEIVNHFKKFFKMKDDKVAVGSDEVLGAEVLTNLMSKYLNTEEAIVFQIAGQAYEYDRVLSAMIEKRNVEFDAKVGMLVAMLGEVLMVLPMIPIGALLMSIMFVLSAISSVMRF